MLDQIAIIVVLFGYAVLIPVLAKLIHSYWTREKLLRAMLGNVDGLWRNKYGWQYLPRGPLASTSLQAKAESTIRKGDAVYFNPDTGCVSRG